MKQIHSEVNIVFPLLLHSITLDNKSLRLNFTFGLLNLECYFLYQFLNLKNLNSSNWKSCLSRRIYSLAMKCPELIFSRFKNVIYFEKKPSISMKLSVYEKSSISTMVCPIYQFPYFQNVLSMILLFMNCLFIILSIQEKNPSLSMKLPISEKSFISMIFLISIFYIK